MYHGSCPDGFTAAWAAWKKYPDAEFVEVTHTDAKKIPDVTGKVVYILDFCFSRERLLDLKSRAASLIVLDHHKSAFEAVGDLPFCQFDMTRSGAGLAWDYFHGPDSRPWIVNYVEYRDLGGTYNNTVHPLPYVQELLYAMDSYEKNFKNWDLLSARVDLSEDLSTNQLVIEGQAIARYAGNLVKMIVDRAHDVVLDGYRGRVANTPVLQSEVANVLAQSRDFGLCWYQLPMKTKFSIRSKEGKVDVCKLAQSFPGGGGHVRAAGFSGPKIDIESLLLSARVECSDE
jgi:hypothetical protein